MPRDSVPLPPVRYTQAADGTRLGYREYGNPDAPLAMVFTNGYATSSFYWQHVLEHFDDKARLITWDLKGHGDSSAARSLDACTIPDSVDDLRRIMDASELEQATLVGFSLGCQIVLEAWRHIPGRIRSIVPILGTYGRPFDNLINPRFGQLALGAFRSIQWAGGLGLRTTAAASRLPLTHKLNQVTGMIGPGITRRKMRPFYKHLGQIHGPTWVSMGLAAQEHSAQDLLDSIGVPVLVIAGGRDLFTPQRLSHEMRDRIPDAELVTLPQATHTGLYEEPDAICAAMEDFFSRRLSRGA